MYNDKQKRKYIKDIISKKLSIHDVLSIIKQAIENCDDLPDEMGYAVADVIRKRYRQMQMWNDDNNDDFTFLGIIGEEYGELCRCVLHDKFGGPAATEKGVEKVHLAASCLGFVERGLADNSVSQHDNDRSPRKVFNEYFELSEIFDEVGEDTVHVMPKTFERDINKIISHLKEKGLYVSKDDVNLDNDTFELNGVTFKKNK